MTLGELARRLGGTLNGEPDLQFSKFTLDSRDDQTGAVFLAVRGAKIDGHQFVEQVLASGAVAAVVEDAQPAGPTITVLNLEEALARFGRSLRDEFGGPVIGITGSNGKTSCKEMVAQVLGVLGPTLKTEGNRNTELTSPLTWFSLTPEHRSAVIEMGMRGIGQIRHLAEVSHPTHAVITMIGTSHIELVGSRQGIAAAKSEILEKLPSSGMAVLWNEDEFLPFLRDRSPAPTRTFGFGPDADCRIVGYRSISLQQSQVLVELNGRKTNIDLPVIGRHQALNAAAALLVADAVGIDLEAAAQALSQTQLPPMRMEVVQFHGATVMLDNYNASPDSMEAAIKTLDELPATGRRMAVIGAMKELGEFSELGHRRAGRALANSMIERVILYGEETEWLRDEAIQLGFDPGRLSVASDLSDVQRWLQDVAPGDLVLVKGSRALALEQALEEVPQA